MTKNKTAGRFYLSLLVIVLICVTVFCAIALPGKMGEIRAERGVLDLADADFSDTLYGLNGEWEFYYGQLYAPDDFINGRPDGGAFIQVPRSWGRAGYPQAGCATYRLTILTDETDLMIFVPQIINSSIVWVNGEKRFEAGVVGRTEAETVPGTRNAFVSVRPENGRAEIVIQAANFNFVLSGLQHTIEFGRSDVLTRDAVTRRVALGLVLGIFLAMFFYHIVLFLHRKKETVYLAFALACLFMGLRVFIGANALADLLLPGGVGAWGAPMQTLALVFHFAAVTWFAHAYFSIPLKGKAQRIVCFVSFALSCAVALPRAPMMIALLITVPLAWLIIRAIRLKRLRGNPYNKLFLFALVFYILWGIFQFVAVNVLRVNLFSAPVLPNLFLVLSQCVMLSVSYTENQRQKEELAAQTDFYRKMSHNMRTPLTKISTNIQIANRENETDHERLNKSQDEIMRLADMIDTALDDGGESGADQ